jgi:hypothetical protein
MSKTRFLSSMLKSIYNAVNIFQRTRAFLNSVYPQKFVSEKWFKFFFDVNVSGVKMFFKMHREHAIYSMFAISDHFTNKWRLWRKNIWTEFRNGGIWNQLNYRLLICNKRKGKLRGIQKRENIRRRIDSDYKKRKVNSFAHNDSTSDVTFSIPYYAK